ncbi:DUF998 domain-containing protein [Actinoplanes friuliensis]|uniref:DUF998 domain-containing protein n=1 Tax=Actinoplanes friuliensis DSM 7358 TaxID=1246995 RepID=U5VX29_9ACTN|nr:DUF998 domain-containing protein [Actinoplanes friuliensis]AGZ41347.1 hypothetical protein AFR_15325 [Actinoplanes friuliensis DSM 7358]
MTTVLIAAAAAPARPPSRPSRLLAAGLVAGPLFTAAYLVEGALRGDGYSAIRHPVSSLALEAHGWQQIVNFVVCGLLVMLFSAGLRRTLRGGPGAVVVPLLVAVWGAGLIGAGAFLTDPVGGYPTSTGPATWHGQVHDLVFSLPGFAALFLAMVTFPRRRSGRFALYSALSGITFAVFFTFATVGFAGTDPWTSTAGLWQRLCVSVGWLWLAALAALCRRMTQVHESL